MASELGELMALTKSSPSQAIASLSGKLNSYTGVTELRTSRGHLLHIPYSTGFTALNRL